MIPRVLRPLFLLVVLACVVLASGPAILAAAPDYDAIADNVVNQSLGVQPGEVVIINGGPDQIDLMGALQVAVSKAGGQPVLQLGIPEANKRAIMETPIEHLKRTPTFGLMQARVADCIINVASIADPTLFADVPEERLAAMRQAGAPLNEAFRRVRYRSVSLGQTGGIPTKAYSDSQGADHEQMTKMFWKAVGVPADTLAAAGNKVAGMLHPGASVRMTSAAGTDVSFKVAQVRARINAGGTADVVQVSGPASVWLPAGEAYACVAKGSAKGTVVVPHLTFRGMPVKNLKMTFTDGRITQMSADKNGDALKAFFETTSANSKDLSIVDIGLNPSSQPLDGSQYLSWEMGGMVTLGVGNNSWAGGDNDADGGLTFHLVGADLTIDGEKVVANGRLESRITRASR